MIFFDEPLVSVLMTSYNRENFISEAIESVLASTYKNFELIIVDDCSSDSTLEIAKQYEVKDSRLKVFKNIKNLGDYANRNEAASHASGKYLKYLDSDDIIFPWGLSTMVQCIEAFPNAAIGLCSGPGSNIKYPQLLSPESAYKSYFFKNQILISGPTGAIINRTVFESYYGFRATQFIGDTDLWLRITQKNSIAIMPPGLIYWREHEGQQIVEEKKNQDIEAVRFRLILNYLNDEACPLSKKDAQLAIQNVTNIKCRRIIQDIFRGKIEKGLKRRQKLGLRTKDFFKALRRNSVPIFSPL